MRFGPADLPDMSGRTAVVTGANAGIGAVTARELAKRGANVVLACRNVDAGRSAASSMAGSPRVEQLDLASQESVHQFAERWEGPLHLLINNAGVMTPPRYRQTVDGGELMFGTNHLGHFALTGRLLPALMTADNARVVTVSSIAHHHGDESVLAANPPEGYKPEPYYGNSKLANLLFAFELHRRLSSAGSHVTSTAAHPGVSATNLVASPDGMGANRFVRAVAPHLLPLIFQPAEKGAVPSLYAATLAAPGTFTGPQRIRETRGPIGPAKASEHARNEQLARDLWTLSEDATGMRFEF